MSDEPKTKSTGKKTRRRYSDEDKAAALVLLRSNSGLDSPLTATANQLQIADSTLLCWAQGRGVSERAKQIAEQESKTLAGIYDDIALMGALELRERLAGDDSRAMMANADLVRVAGMSVEKRQLLSGQPTSITETRNDQALREKAEAILQKLLLEYSGDRDQALAAFREHAPTLSGYVN